jgi:hypothetical protein
MTHVLTLVTPDDRPVLDDAAVARAAALLQSAGEPDWLRPQIAADLPFAPADAFAARELAERIRTGARSCSSRTWIPP